MAIRIGSSILKKKARPVSQRGPFLHGLASERTAAAKIKSPAGLFFGRIRDLPACRAVPYPALPGSKGNGPSAGGELRPVKSGE
jgi:hypothetical protein